MTGAELVFERRDQAQRNEQQRSLTDEVDPIAGGIDSRRESDRTYRRQAKQECCKHGLPFAQCMPGSDDGCCHHACNRECGPRSEEHTSELQSLMRISYAVFCLKKKKTQDTTRQLTSGRQQ